MGYYAAGDGYWHGFLNDGTTWEAINYPGAYTTIAFDINNSNDIIGFFTDAAGDPHGFLATPTPEPATLLLLASGLIGLVGFRKLKN